MGIAKFLGGFSMVGSRSALVSRAGVTGAGRRSRTSVLALLLAGAAMIASPLGAATLDLLGATANRSDLSLAGVPYDFVENGTVNLSVASDLTFAGVLQDGAGVFSLTKLGGAALTLSGANTYSGETRITSGTLIAGADNSLSANSRVRIGATLDLAGFDQTVRGFYQSGTIVSTSGGAVTLTTNPGVLNSFSGDIVESAGNAITLVKIGVGEQNLIGTSNHTGGTTLGGGILGVGTSAAIGTGAVTVTVAGSTLKALGAGITLANNFVLTQNIVVDAAGLSPTLTGNISGAGSLTKSGAGSLTITNTGNSYTGGTFIQLGSLLVGGDNVLGTNDVTVGPAAAIGTNGVSALLSNNIVANAQTTLLAPNAQVLDLAGVISGIGNVVVQGTTGTVILRNANNYTGTTTLNGGTLGVGNNLSLGGADRSLFIGGPATLKAFNNVTLANNLRLAANTVVDTNGFDMSLTDTVNNATAGLTGGLTKVGAGTLTLGAANNYSGGTTLVGGVLSVSANNRLNVIGGLTFNGGSLQVTGTSFTTTARAVTLLGTGEIEVVAAANDFILSDPITGAGSLIKTGAGTLTLAAANTFGGGVTLTAGNLNVQNNDALGAGVATLNGVVLVAGVAVLTLANDITVGAATVDTQSNALTLSGDIGGAGTLTKFGTGTLTLTGANTF